MNPEPEQRSVFSKPVKLKRKRQQSVVDQPFRGNYYLGQDFLSVQKMYEQYKLKKTAYLQAMNSFSAFKSKLSKEAVPEEKERIRRSRKDKQGRNHRCGCSKTYLSYPALYTHIKTKHGGVQPPGTTRSANNGSKRGRPKRKPNEEDDRKDNDQLMFEDRQQCANFFENALDKAGLNVFQKYGEYVDGQTTYQKAEESITERRWLVWMENFKRLSFFKQIGGEMSLDLVFSIYLYSLYPIVNSRYFSDVVRLLEAFRTFLNKKYKQILHDYCISTGKRTRAVCLTADLKTQICECQNAEYIPLAVEQFANEYLMELGQFDREVSKCSLIDFCRWLFLKNLTSLHLQQE